jgi:alkylated DNA repair dioxygenase AlkB
LTPSTQPDLFGDSEPPFPDGFELRDAFIDEDTERVLLAHIGSLVLAPARYKAYTARRLVASFGGQFDYDANVLRPGAPLPDFLAPLRERAGAWLGVASDAFDHALVAKYPPGTPLGWHRDVPDFDNVFGLSLGAPARLKLRPFGETPSRQRTLNVTLKPRSAYLLRGPARWAWQHAIAPTEAMRWSITLRTRRVRR